MMYKKIVLFGIIVLLSLVRVNAFDTTLIKGVNQLTPIKYNYQDVSIELLKNYCNSPVDCLAELKLCNNRIEDIDYNFDVWFDDEKKINTYSTLISGLVQVENKVKDLGECESCYIDNKTSQEVCNNYECLTGYHYETEYVEGWIKANSIKIKSGQCEIIRLEGNKNPYESVDWKIDYMGIKPNWAWWNNDYAKCRDITLRSDYVETDQTNFPAYIELNSTTFSGMESDWDDFRIVNSPCGEGGNSVPYEVENYTSINAYVWFKSNLTSGSDTVYSIYYDYASATNGEDKEGVWDSDYLAVYHFAEADGNALDSTYNNKDCILVGATPKLIPNGRFGVSMNFSGVANNYLKTLIDPDVDIVDDNPYSVEVFYNYRLYDNTNWYLWNADGISNSRFYASYPADDQTAHVGIGADTPDFNTILLILGVDMSVTYTYDVSDYNVTRFGNLTHTVNVGSEDTADSTNMTLLQNVAVAGTKYFFNGYIDELRVSTTARSLDWINATEQNSLGNLVNIGLEETPDMSPQYWDIREETDPQTYTPTQNYGFSINCTDDVGMGISFFEHNASGSFANITMTNVTNIYYANITSMAVGVLNYSFYCNDTSSNQNQTPYYTFTVNKGDSGVNLLLDDTGGTYYFTNNSLVNVTAYNDLSYDVTIESNITGFGTHINETSPYEVFRYFYCSVNNTLFNVTAFSYGNENYSDSTETHYAICDLESGLKSGNVTRYQCIEDDYLQISVYDALNTTDVTYTYEYCEYGCAETIIGTRCNYSPFINNLIMIVIFIIGLGIIYVLIKILGGLFK